MSEKPIIAIANDHAAVALKHAIVPALEKQGFLVEDLGCHTHDSVDYPDQAQALCQRVLSGEAEKGVLICGSGIGMSMAANRFKGIRAALCYTQEAAKLARQHNNANVLVLSARLVDEAENMKMVEAFFTTEFEGGRHQTRIEKIEHYSHSNPIENP